MQNDSSKFKNDFEKRLIKFSIRIIRLCSELRSERNNWAIADQLIRSATSVGANVIEAKAYSSKKEYIKYFEISLKSANETKYWLILVRECSANNKEKAIEYLCEACEIAKIISSGVLTMKGKR